MIKKYEVCSNHQRNDNLAIWLSQCKKEKKPYVYILTKSKYADITWDCMSLPTSYDSLFGKTLHDEALEICGRYMCNKSRYEIGNTNITYFNIPIDTSYSLAIDLFNLINDKLPRN